MRVFQPTKCRYSQVFWKSLPPVDIPDPWMSWYHPAFLICYSQAIVPYSVLLNSCSEMQWEARVHPCRSIWNLNEFKLANSFPMTIMILNGVQFQGHGGTHHPAVLSTWIHVKQLHTRTSIRASMSMAPLCICWPRTILWSVLMGRAWQWSVLRLIKWDAQIMATWTMGDCLGPWFDWTENNVFYGLMMICTYVYIMNLNAVTHMMCFFAYESLLMLIVYDLYMYCVLSISILFPNIYETSVYFMVIDTCMPDPCFLGDLDQLKKHMWIVKCTKWNM